MVRLKRQIAKKTGLPPGSLIHIGNVNSETIKLSLVEYDEQTLIQKENASIQECLERIETPLMTWIEVDGVSDPTTIQAIGTRFKLHNLVLEDILNTGQRSKLDIYQDQLFIVVRRLMLDDKTQELKDEQVSIILGPNYLICFLEKDGTIFNPIRDRLKQPNSRIRKSGSDYLAYALLDVIVDHYFVVLEKIDIKLDNLEDELSRFPKPSTLLKIQSAKRDMIFLRKSVWPMREVIGHFQRLESPLINPTTQLYLRDVHDHTIQTIDMIEGFRDVVSSMLDIYLSNINIRTNEIMKVLTIVSTIFVPLTFITSFYGMNIDYIPGMHHSYSYLIVMGSMLLTALGMLAYFHHRKWF